MRLVYQQLVPADVDNGNFRSCFGNPLQQRPLHVSAPARVAIVAAAERPEMTALSIVAGSPV